MLQHKRLMASVLLVTTLIVGLGVYFFPRNAGVGSTLSVEAASQELSLVRPVFAATSLPQEAGMSIWLNATAQSPLSLDAANNAMVNIENATSDYVVGVISLQSVGFSSDDWPHCFVHKSGWIVVYYLKVNTANLATSGWLGKMIVLSSSDWYDGTTLKENLLHKALVLICQVLNVNPIDAQYYHFQYPSATTLEIAIKSSGWGETRTFNIKIPGSLAIDERSWSFYSENGGSWKIDTTQIVSGSGRHYGGSEITAPMLTPDAWHTVSMTSPAYGMNNHARVCILILYH